MGLTVVGKPAATVMTSYPSLSCFSPSLGEVKALKATKLAEEQELCAIDLLQKSKIFR
ncbi:hypothetical protein [Microcystis sp. T1-4]|uniref:hypothetical protein n=2 Tax=Microcystaceae TaxID=1890449 RepID=UPI00350E99F1